MFVGFLILFLSTLSIQPCAAGLTLEVVSTSLSVSPPDTVTLLFRLTSAASEELQLALDLELPDNWTSLIPPGTATLQPGETKLLTFPIRIPDRTRAGTYTVKLQAASEAKGIAEEASIDVRVEQSFQVSVEGPAQGKRAILGEEVSYSLFIINEGNIPSTFTISASSICPVSLDKKTVDLVSAERAEIEVTQLIPEDLEGRRECTVRVTAQSEMQKDVSDEFRITTTILPSPPEQVRKDLGLIYDMSVWFSETWAPGGERSRRATIFGYGETSEVKSNFSLTFDDLFHQEVDLIEELNFYAEFSDYSLQFGDVGWRGGNWFSISGRGIRVDTEQESLPDLSLTYIEDGQYGAKLELTGAKHILSLSGLGFGEGIAAPEGVDFSLVTDQENDTRELGIECGVDTQGWAARMWNDWKGERSVIQTNLRYIDAPFSSYTNSSLEFDVSQTFDAEVINLWGRLGYDHIWDETGVLNRTSFGVGSSGNFGEDYPDFNLGVRYRRDKGILNGTNYRERTQRFSAGLDQDFEQISADFRFTQMEKFLLDSTKVSTVTNISASLSPDIESLSPEVRFEWSKTSDFTEDVVVREAGVIFSGRGEIDDFDCSFSLSMKRVNELLEISAGIETELPQESWASISLEAVGDNLSFELDLEKSFSYIANWWPVKGQTLGSVFVDQNLNGKFDENEPGLSEIILKLGENLASTNSSGNFAFPPDEPGCYDLQLVKLPGDYVSMKPTTQTVSLKAGKRIQVNIPISKAAKVTGKVIRLPEPTDGEQPDNHGALTSETENGKQTLPEVGLRLVGEKRSYYTRTGGGGRFRFRRLRPGDWRIDVDKDTLPTRHYPKRERIRFKLAPGEEKQLQIIIFEEEREIQWLD